MHTHNPCSYSKVLARVIVLYYIVLRFFGCILNKTDFALPVDVDLAGIEPHKFSACASFTIEKFVDLHNHKFDLESKLRTTEPLKVA